MANSMNTNYFISITTLRTVIFKNTSDVPAAAWSNEPIGKISQYSSTEHTCDLTEILSWQKIELQQNEIIEFTNYRGGGFKLFQDKVIVKNQT